MNKPHVAVIRLAVVTGILLNLLNCANPVDEPPLTWRSKVVAPLTDERFMVAEQLDSIFKFEDLEVVKADTLSFAVSRVDSASYERTENAFDTMYFRVKVGTLKLQNMRDVDATLPYDGTGTVAVPSKVPLSGVKNVVFDNNDANVLDVTFSNNTDAAFDTVIMTIADVGVDTVTSLASGATAHFQFDMRDKTVSDSLAITTVATSGTHAGGTVAMHFSLNGLTVFSMEVLDSLIAFSQEYVNRYELTDSMNLDYVDIDRGSFVYKILNHCGVSFNLHCVHDHIWETNFCESRGVDKLSELAEFGSDDSIHFNGGLPSETILAGPNTSAQLRKVNLNGSRLFPVWDDSLKKSVTNVRYAVEILAAGQYVKLSALDSMMFTITTSEFEFGAMAGTFTETMVYDVDTQKIAIELPWNNTVKDSLRGGFELTSVIADLDLNTRLGSSSQVDTLDMDIFAFDPESTSIRDSLATRITDLSNDSTYKRSIDITHVANGFSDSIGLAVRMKIPAGTYVKFASDTREPLPPGIIGRMAVDALTDFRLNAKLDWKINRDVDMDLGSSRVPLPEALQYFRKMSNRSAEFIMGVRNFSNIQVSLFSLAAPDTLMDTLDSLSQNEVTAFLRDNDAALQGGYVNLFGTDGIVIPKRDTSEYTYSTVTLDDKMIQQLLATDSLAFRWIIRFREQDRDALKLTDFIDIKSRLSISGTNNTDSLLIW